MTTLCPPAVHPATTVSCIICLRRVSLSSVTAGSLHADSSQAFACTIHLAQRAQWIVSWALFDYQQSQIRAVAKLAESLS